MNKSLFFTCIVSLGLSGCIHSSEDVQYFPDVPAVVAYNRDIGKPVLITATEVFIAPELEEYFRYYMLHEGEAILAYFNLDMNQEPVQGYRTITNFDCHQIGNTTVVEEKEVDKDDYVPVDKAQPFALIVHEKTIFMYVSFTQNSRYRKYVYDMTYEAGETSEIPTLSVRSKGAEGEYATTADYWTPYIFEMYDYIMSQPKDSKNQVIVNLRYKKGVDSSGNEIWAYCEENPLAIPVP